MSLLDKQRELEDAPDSFLQQLLQQGDKQYPAWLVHAVADARADMRQRFQNQEALAQAEQPKIVDKTMAKLGGIPDVDPNQAGGDPSLATGIAGGMAGGGVIRGYFEGDLVGDEDEELTEAEAAEAALEAEATRVAEEYLQGQRTGGTGILGTGLGGGGPKIGHTFQPEPQLVGQGLDEPVRRRAWQKINEMLEAQGDREAFEAQLAEIDATEGGQLYPDSAEDRMGLGGTAGDRSTQLRELGYVQRAPAALVAGQRSLRMAAEHPEVYEAILADNPGGIETVDWERLDNPASLKKLRAFIPETAGATPQEESEQEVEGEVTDEELQALLDALNAGDSDALTASREQRGYHQSLVNRGLGFIGDVETARQWDERHDEVQRRKAFEQETVMKNARDIAEQRGTNAEERQEIYDALMDNFSTQIADLESVRADRARQQAQREAGMPRRLRAAALRQARTGDQSITTAAEDWQEELETFRTDEDNLMTQLRTLTQTQYEKGIQWLEELQDYRMTTDKNLDQAVLDNIRFSTGQYEEEAFHDDLLKDELLDDRLGLLKSALSGAGSIDVADIGARAAAANARLASTSQFKNFASDPNNWDAFELMVRDLQQAYDEGSPERQQLEDALQFIGEDSVSSLIQQAKAGGSSTGGLSLVGQDVRGAVGGTGGRDERLIPLLEAVLNKIPAGDRTPLIELIYEYAGQ